LASVIPRSAFALGIAIFTIDESRTTISCEIATTNRVLQRSLKIISGATIFKISLRFIDDIYWLTLSEFERETFNNAPLRI
jgi:hypothetical protein